MRTLAELGYDAVEICRPHLNTLNLGEMDATERKAFQRRAVGYGIEISAVGGYAAICHEDAERRLPAIESFKEAMDFAADIEVELVTTHTSYAPAQFYPGSENLTPIRRNRLARSMLHQPQVWSFVLDVLGELARYAERRGVVIALDDHDPSPAMFYSSVVREIGSPALGLNLQVTYGEKPADAVRRRPDVIRNVHVEPSQGIGSWSIESYIDFINALKGIGYKSYFTIEEHYSSEEFRQMDPEQNARKHLRYFDYLMW
jgi:sugar phosphate isomerase/epimerase